MSAACRGFHWIGQTRRSCDECGRPQWEHDGWAKFTGSFLSPSVTVEPWSPETAERMSQAAAAWNANQLYEEREGYIRSGVYVGQVERVRSVWRYGKDIPDGVQDEVLSREVVPS